MATDTLTVAERAGLRRLSLGTHLHVSYLPNVDALVDRGWAAIVAGSLAEITPSGRRALVADRTSLRVQAHDEAASMPQPIDRQRTVIIAAAIGGHSIVAGESIAISPDHANAILDQLTAEQHVALGLSPGAKTPTPDRAVELEAQNARLRTALEFYADEDNYGSGLCDGIPGHLDEIDGVPEWEFDNGSRARAALALNTTETST